jgi:hypothetical protein
MEPPRPPARASLGPAPRPSSVAEAVVRDPPPPEGVLPAVQQQLPRLTQCVPEDVRARGALLLRVRARIDAEGRLRAPRVDAQEELGPAALACLTDGLERVRIPPLGSGASRVVSFSVWLGSR